MSGRRTVYAGAAMNTAHEHARVLASSRLSSEDRAGVFERARDLVIVVADGAGGLRGGAAASDALVDAVRLAAHDESFDVYDARRWVRIFEDVDASLSTMMAGETTAVLVVVGGDMIAGVSAGDSEAWFMTTTSLDDLTANQNKARLGSGRASPVHFHRRCAEGWLVVGTDGLFNYVSHENIAATVRAEGGPHAVAKRLASLARTPSGTYQDDLGIVVVSFG